jgi:hypothetical protein
MAKEEKPLEYQPRERTTKSLAQRLALDYLKRPSKLSSLRSRIVWALLAAAGLVAVPMVLGLPGGRRALLSGPVSSAHTLFLDGCDRCHAKAFARVPDAACKTCHDGPPHPAKPIDTARLRNPLDCAGCHVEHRGAAELANVVNGNCTGCHGNLKAHATGVKLAGTEITAFRPGKHPEFSALARADLRPIRLNHSKHMMLRPAPRYRGMTLPMKCQDCHATDSTSPTGDPVPVTFAANCRSCHARELEFDVYYLLGDRTGPAPHTEDPKTIHQFILESYRQALAEDPTLIRRRIGQDLPMPDSAKWLESVVHDSESFLFRRKCTYCHEYSGYSPEGFPAVRKINLVRHRYVEDQRDGERWLLRAEFGHRSHRAVDCESCHRTARDSTRTADVLIPAMQNCLPCHGGSAAGLDRCSKCHLFHNKGLEQDRRRPTEQLLTGKPGVAQ